MPKLTRETVVQFGSSGASTNFGQFGSKTAGTPQTSQNPSIIQALAAWVTGWTAAAVGAAFNPYLEDMNGFCFVVGYFLSNIFERGIPDWDSGTTYYLGATVQDPAGSGQQFISLQDNNLNNALPLSGSNAFWQWNNQPTGCVLDPSGNVLIGGGSNDGLAKAQVNGSLEVKSGGVIFPDGSEQTTAILPINPSAQNVVTGSRSLNTIFHNTGTKPLFVAVSIFGGSGGGTWFNASALTDSAATPTTTVATINIGATGSGTGQLFFIVLPGNYYKVSATGTSLALSQWTEWQ